MRIGIDARELCGRPTGVGRYLLGLLREWGAHQGRARRHEFVLYAPEALTVSLDARRFPTRLVLGAPGVLWEQVRLPWVARRDHLDAFFGPAYSAPATWDLPTVVAIHDVSFVAHPEWFRTREGVRRRWLTRRAARHAREIITISEFSRRQLIEHLGVLPSRVHVIPPGITAPARTRRAPGPEWHLLFVGSIFNRRHVPDLIRAFGDIARDRPDVSLDVVGDNRTFPREDIPQTIAREGLDGRVRWHAYVSDKQLSALYARAHGFAFLSEYEGLGLTPLEALAAGIPPVLLDTPVARESCGEAALYVAKGDLAATRRALERVLFDEEVRRRLLAAAPAVLRRYCWPEAACQVLEVIESAATKSTAHAG